MIKDRGLLIGIALTILIIAGGIYFFTKAPKTQDSTPQVVSNSVLIPSGVQITSGFLDGKYLPATDSAKLTIVEFADFQCPACALYNPLVEQLLSDFAGKINYVFRHFPLTQHKNAVPSSLAAEAAGKQNKFWEMHKKLYDTQEEWANLGNSKEKFVSYAEELGLDKNKFSEDYESPDAKKIVNTGFSDGTTARINATPTFFFNGVKLNSVPSSYEELKALVQKELE